MVSKFIVSIFWVSGIAIVIAAPEMDVKPIQQALIGYIGCFVFLLFAVIHLFLNLEDKQ